jgi:hypothetical protein
MESGAKSYMRKCTNIFIMYEEVVSHEFPIIYEENFHFFFISV